MKKTAVAKFIGSALVGMSILAACGGGGGTDSAANQGEINSWLQANGYSAEEAECVASEISEDYELSDFDNLNDADDAGLGSSLVDIREKCGR